MTARGQEVLFAHLVDPESLEVIAHEGINTSIIPDEDLRPVLSWTLDYYFSSGCQRAPSVEALYAQFGDILNDAGLDLEHEPEDSVEWAIDDLKASWVFAQSTKFSKDFAVAMAEAPKADRIEIVNDFGSELVRLGLALEPRHSRANFGQSGDDIMRAYGEREANKGQFRGMGLGIPNVDDHFNGIHEGELAVLGAGPKTGKSFFQCWVAFKEWSRGRNVCLFTLENSVEMTMDRIACIALTIDGGRFERGELTPQEKVDITTWLEWCKASPFALWVLKPDLGQRSFPYMVREAQLRGADTLLIDQLTHVEVGQGIQDRRPRTEKIGEALHQLKAMISTGRHHMPCLLTHQINREGIKAADKTGRLEMAHMAESAEIERTADFVLGLYQSRDELGLRQAKLQTLGARRVPSKNWQIDWRPEVGYVKYLNEAVFEQ